MNEHPGNDLSHWRLHGNGLATAEHLAKSGHRIFAGIRRDDDARKVEALNPLVKAVILDVTKRDQVESAYEAISKASDTSLPFNVVNNAGVAVSAPIEGLPLENLRRQLEINVVGQVSVTQVFSPLLRKAQGRVVMIGSIAGLHSTPFLGAYSASKFALEAITASLRMEMHSTGVRVFMIRPGPIATPIWEKNFGTEDELLSQLPADVRNRYATSLQKFITAIKSDLPRAIPANDVAIAVARCLHEKNPPLSQIVASRIVKMELTVAKLLPVSVLDSEMRKKYLC